MRALFPGVILRAGSACALLALAGCGDDMSRAFGLTRDTPDEFTVTTRAPLSMPPDYALRPPEPGAPRPQEQDAPLAAEEALVPQTALSAPAASTADESTGQQALVADAGPTAPPDIRARISADRSLDEPSESLTDRLMFWKKPPPPGVVVDPQAEAQRLRTDQALGESVQTGDTPIIQRQQSSGGLFGGLF
jgi:hypothetical protein